MNKNSLRELTKINMSKMERLSFNFATVTPVIMQDFFLTGNFSLMKDLNLQMLTNAGNVLKMVIRQKFPKLEKLYLP